MIVYISHNEFGHANPSAFSERGTEVIFDIEKIDSLLKEKIYGKMQLMEVSKQEAENIFAARTGQRSVSISTIKNLFKL